MFGKNKKKIAELEKQLANAEKEEKYLKSTVDTLLSSVQRKHDELTELRNKAYIRNDKGQIIKLIKK